MRLLNVNNLEFEECVGDGLPAVASYAILSHTWGQEEVSFADHVSGQSSSKSGYQKIRSCCKLASSEGFRHVWIDTCCIDKSSSAELSEAINSMFQWYRDAAICYAYLSDVDSSEDPAHALSSFSRSRWFTRGWTLQELLAPAEVIFLGSDWTEIGTKGSLCATVSRITGIDEKVLSGGDWSRYSVAQKMSWAAGRQTTRPEDEAYCLMGLFDVNMPLLYGEGRKAFSRLQQEILRISDDQSIFAWSHPEVDQSHLHISGLMAPSPEHFKHASGIHLMEFASEHESLFEVVNQLVRITVRTLDGVQALRMRMQLAEPLCYRIVEVQSSQARTNSKTQDEPISLSTPSVLQDSLTQEPQELIAPAQIAITVQDEHSETTACQLDDIPESTPTEDISKASDTGRYVLPQRGAESGDWFHYIYEPVMVVPLRCHIEGNQLGILLSQGSTDHIGVKALSRLHKPSLVTLDAAASSSLGPLITTYAVISTKPKLRINESSQARHNRWPRVRTDNLISAGYGIDKRYIVSKPSVLAYHVSGNDSAHPTFLLNISHFASGDSLLCHVEVYGSDVTTMLEYDLYSFDLAVLRRAQVPLGNGNGVAIIFREVPGEEFVSLSIEPLLIGSRCLVEKSTHSSTVGGWLIGYQIKDPVI